MKNNKIKFVREYKSNGDETIYEIIYYSRRCVMCFGESELPETVKKFLKAATRVTKQYDYTSTRKNKNEIIYEA